MSLRKCLILIVLAALALSAYAAWHFQLPRLAWHWAAMHLQAEQRASDSVWLPYYRVSIEGQAIQGVDDASGLTFNEDSGTLFSITNSTPQRILELDTEGRLLRQIELSGAPDPEGITHVRGNIFAISDEREHSVFRVEIEADTRHIDLSQAPRIELPPSTRKNLSYEGISWDANSHRLFVSQEKAPMRIFAITGFDDSFTRTEDELWITEWRPANLGGLFINDLSSLSFHEASGRMLLLSDESALIVEYSADGHPVSLLPMWRGLHGLSRRVPQAEGLAVGRDGTLYVISEPNLFYRFERSQPAPWASSNP